ETLKTRKVAPHYILKAKEVAGRHTELESERMSDIYRCYYYNLAPFSSALAGIHHYASYFRPDGGRVRSFDA
ncbi:hypothetical protein, partial [Klebsiella pneumoniae]|uniref:hypothetical protein n=1 Tax=Klebsiella pneumoniae TaxID=573 RepID=UPI001D0F3470